MGQDQQQQGHTMRWSSAPHPHLSRPVPQGYWSTTSDWPVPGCDESWSKSSIKTPDPTIAELASFSHNNKAMFGSCPSQGYHYWNGQSAKLRGSGYYAVFFKKPSGSSKIYR